ncbi:phosphonate C-P lyase system protein PhnG [Rhodopila globiformis]|nr:phosphonate C-P lyase system protein PhnG [Rhodopila globiformis]
MNDHSAVEHPCPERPRWMAVLARAPAGRLEALLDAVGERPAYTLLRAPESGLVMVRGRIGGGGAAFNLGEMTVTRCAVCIDSGPIGHAYVTGRASRRAELAALVDALMQDPARTEALEARVIAPLEQEQADRQAQRAGKAAATRVQFFAMQTMRT